MSYYNYNDKIKAIQINNKFSFKLLVKNTYLIYVITHKTIFNKGNKILKISKTEIYFSEEEIDYFMNLAIKEGIKAKLKNEVPIGAIIVSEDKKVIAKAHNSVETKHSAINHAEILAIQLANKKLNSKYLTNCSIFISLEPCPMCAAAISTSKIKNVFFGCEDKKGGAIINGIQLYKNQKNLYIPNVIYQIQNNKSSLLLKEFFKNIRFSKKNNLKEI